MSTATKTKRPPAKPLPRKPRAARGVVQGSMAGSAKLAADFDPSAPAFPASEWKHLRK